MNSKVAAVNGLKEHLLRDRDYELLFYLARNNKHSQRDISSCLGFSLGLTNIIIKRMVKMGYVKTKHLSKSRMQYLLTPKGFLKATKKSYNYLLKTVNSVKLLKGKIVDIVNRYYAKNVREFVIIGSNELAEIVEIAIENSGKNDIEVVRSDKYVQALANSGVILDTTGAHFNQADNSNYVDLYKALSHTLV